MESTAKDKVPRKIKKQMPGGPYCYTPTGETSQVWHKEIKQFVTAYHVKLCPFWVGIKAKDKPKQFQTEIDKKFPEHWIGWCKLIKMEIDDQCKSCTIKRNY